MVSANLPPAKFTQGITLVEMLVVLVLCSTLIVIITSLGGQFFSNVHESEQRRDEAANVHKLMHIFENDLSRFYGNYHAHDALNLEFDAVIDDIVQRVHYEISEVRPLSGAPSREVMKTNRVTRTLKNPFIKGPQSTSSVVIFEGTLQPSFSHIVKNAAYLADRMTAPRPTVGSEAAPLPEQFGIMILPSWSEQHEKRYGHPLGVTLQLEKLSFSPADDTAADAHDTQTLHDSNALSWPRWQRTIPLLLNSRESAQ